MDQPSNEMSGDIKNNIEQYSIKKLMENYEELVRLTIEKQKSIKEMESNLLLNSSNLIDKYQKQIMLVSLKIELQDTNISQLNELVFALTGDNNQNKQNYQLSLENIRKKKLIFTEESLLRDLKIEIDNPTLFNQSIPPNKPPPITSKPTIPVRKDLPPKIPPKKDLSKKPIKKESIFSSFGKKKPETKFEQGSTPEMIKSPRNEINSSNDNLPKQFQVENIKKWMKENYKHGNTFNFTNNFPLPITYSIFSYLKDKDLAKLSMTCKHWNRRVKQWKNAVTKNDVVYEIYSSEREYLTSLNVMINEYKSTLLKKQIIDGEGSHTLFSNIDQIYSINKELLLDLEKRLSTWNSLSCIGDIFYQVAPYLKMYSTYAANHETATNFYNKLVEKKTNFKILEMIRKKKEVRSLDLQSYLILPIQRIPRYSLLLGQLLKVTPKEHKDHTTLEKAIETVDNVASNLDKSVKQFNDAGTMLKISNQISEFPISLFRDPMRKLLKEGVLVRTGKKLTTSSWVILTTDLFVYANKIISGWKFKGSIPLSTIWTRNIENSQKNQYLFQLISTNKVFDFSVGSQDEKDVWLNCINQAIKNLVKTSVVEKQKRMTRVIDFNKINKNLQHDSLSESLDSSDTSNLSTDNLQVNNTSSSSEENGNLKPKRTPPPPPNKKPPLPPKSKLVVIPNKNRDSSSPSLLPQFESKTLIRFKGDEWVTVCLRPCSFTQITQGESYILDAGKKVFIWKGKQSNVKERAKATYFAKKMIENTNIPIIVLKGKSDDPEFFFILGGSVDLIPPKTEDNLTTEFENYLEYRFFVADSNAVVSETILEKGEGLHRDLLESDKSYLINIISTNAVFVWTGLKSNSKQKLAIADKTDEILKKNPNKNVQVYFLFEGEETILFKGLFSDWPDLNWKDEIPEHKKNILQTISDGGKSLISKFKTQKSRSFSFKAKSSSSNGSRKGIDSMISPRDSISESK